MRTPMRIPLLISTLVFFISACGDSSSTSPTTSEGEGGTATPTVTITSPSDGDSITATGDGASIELTYDITDGRDDDAVDCLLDDTSTGLGSDGRCSFENVAVGEHTLAVNVVQGNGDPYTNEGASASVTVVVVGVACESATDCSDEDPCTLAACEGGTCAYYASPIEGCDSGLEDFICKEDGDCSKFVDGMGTCSTAFCAPDSKVCVVSVLEEGAACDDGDTCTADDVCTNGDCVGPNPADCDDGNACTTEECVAGEGCVYTDVICDDEDDCTIDQCTDEGCVFEASEDGCDDGDVCTENDACTDGVCAGTPKDCEDGDLCTPEICDPDTGDCVSDPTVDIIDCDDQNPCTVDTCTEEGCSNAADDSATCDDGDACTEGDLCQGGQCVAGTPKACDNGDACDGIETCDSGSGDCVAGVPVVCGDDDACTTDSCDGGFCVYTPIPNCCASSEDCDNGDPCDGVETCDAGFCSNGPAPVCGDGNIDTECGEECDDGGTEANDGCSAVCVTEIPECQTDQTCDDGNPCTDDVCDTTNGLNKCIYTNNTNVCDDGDECTVSDGCVEGICAGAVKDCEDGIDCTINTCDSAIGCVATEDDTLCTADECKVAFCSEGVGCVQEANPVNGGACNGDECTENGTCQAGECVGDAVDCEDGDVCTGIDCNPTIGCTYLPETNKVCDDGDSCTETDVCGVSGTGIAVCEGTPIAGCGEEGLICSLTGNAGEEVSCFLSIARSQQNEVNALGLQFKMFYDPAKLTLINFYDEFCFMGICQDVNLTGPGKQTLSSGHALTAGPANTADWDGSGFAAFSNFSDTTAFFTDAYVDGNGDIQGDASFVEARFTLVTNVTGGSPAEITLEEVQAFWDFGQDMTETFNGPVIVTSPEQ